MFARLALLLSLALLCGCGGGSNANGDARDAVGTQTVGDDSPATSAGSHRSHRHHHRRHGAASTSPDASAAGTPSAIASGSAAYPCDDAKFVSIQGEFASGALEGDQLVDVCGTVTRVLPARTTRSGLHGYFYLQVAAGDQIEIVSDLAEMNAPAWPWVKPGDGATVRGRYYYDSASSQGIDWTHHGASRSWPSPGYVVVDGTQYQ